MFLAIDIGTSNCKALLGDGERYAIEQAPAPVNGRGCAEQDPTAWWDAVTSLIPRLLARLGIRGRDVQAIALTGHSPSIVPVDRTGAALRACLTWQDRRAQREAAFIAEVTGRRADAGSIEAKILWIRNNEPDIYRETATFLQPKDYITLRLTGNAVIDRPAASFLLFFSPEKSEWTDPGLDVDPAKLPRVCNSWQIAGTLQKKAAAELGLQPGTPVVAGGIDAYCEALGAGVTQKGRVCDMTGTSSCVIACVPDPTGVEGVVPHVIPDRYLCILPLSCTGGSLSWFVSNFADGIPESNLYKNLGEYIALSPPGAHNLIFVPYLTGERSPVWDVDAKGMFFGITSQHTWADFLRAVLEGVSLAVRHNLEVMKAQGLSCHEVCATGGGARLPAWIQIKADVINLPYRQLEVPDGALMGAVILAAHAVTGVPFDELIPRFVRTVRAYRPSPSRKIYDNLFTRYTQLYPATRDLMHGLEPGGQEL